MHHAALETMCPVVVAMVAVNNNRRIVQQPLALKCRQHHTDRIIGHAARAADLVGKSAGKRCQSEAMLNVRNEVPHVNGERRCVSKFVEAFEQRRKVVCTPQWWQVVRPRRKLRWIRCVKGIEANEIGVVAAALEDGEEVPGICCRAHALEF